MGEVTISCFNGREFISAAAHLAERCDDGPNREAMIRTSVNRYYYACFHAMRDKLVKPKDLLDESRTGHTKIIKRARNELSGDTGELFNQLYILRKHADYHNWHRADDSGQYPKCPCPWDDDCRENARHAADLAYLILNSNELSRFDATLDDE